jgi:hypothetical protein
MAKVLKTGNHKPQDPLGILAQVGLLTKLRELLQLSLLSQLVLAEAEEFTLCHGEWPNPRHSGTSAVHQVCITWPTSQLQPTMRHLRTYSMTITLNLQEHVRNRIAFHTEMMCDIMYYNQALQQPDAKQFANAVVKEVNGHVDNKHWILVMQDNVPDNA